jgi:hypothetical protein
VRDVWTYGQINGWSSHRESSGNDAFNSVGEDVSEIVKIKAVGHKEHGKLFIGGKEVRL